MKNKTIIGVVAAVIILVLVGIISSTNIFVDVMWFDNLGYLDVYFKKFVSVAKLATPLWICFMLIIWVYYKNIKKSLSKIKFIREVDVKKEKLEKKIFFFSNIVISFFLALNIARAYWYKILEFTNATSFGVTDPLYGKDISFFVFKLPFIEAISNSIFGILFFMVILTLIIYFIYNMNDLVSKKSVEFKDIKDGLAKFGGKYFAVIALIFFINMAIRFLLRAWNLVYSSRGFVFGASYTDVVVTQKFLYVSAGIAIITGIVVLVGILRKKYKLAITFVIVLFAMIPLEAISAGIVQKLFVESNELKVEEPYIKKNIEYTRKAYNLDTIEESNFKIENTLDYKGLQDNKDTIDNIKILSFNPTLEYYKESQYIKKYYTFNDVDVDRYNINGEYNQVFLAPREIDTNAIDSTKNKWQKDHLVYTHGYGMVMNKVNELTESRDPLFVMGRIPQTNKTDIQLDNPRIYFGEKTNQYVVVNTDVNELDYPGIDGNVSADYEADSGIKMTFLNKVLFALREGEMKFLLSKDIKSDSKILINRNIEKRVQKIAPFLKYDEDPYIFIDGGKLYWMLDAYTTSNRYPFSERTGNINYIRNSVKVVVDAYNGDVKFYIVDESDPIIQTYAKIFPTLFQKEIPEGVKAHYRYPEDYFKVQSMVLGKYHVTDFERFINKEDLWEVAKDGNKVEKEDDIVDPVYMVMNLPGENGAQMHLVNYFNVKGKYNMVGMLAGQMDGEDYGKLKLLKFDKGGSTIKSPTLFNRKVNQDVTISKELTLLDDKGSEVIYGDTLIIPIKDSLLYVEPVYLRAKGEKSIPQVRFVIASFKDRIVKGDTLEDALNLLFKKDEKPEVKPPVKDNGKDQPKDDDFVLGDDKEELIKSANEVFKLSEDAMKNGDWAEYGKQINRLKEILAKLGE